MIVRHLVEDVDSIGPMAVGGSESFDAKAQLEKERAELVERIHEVIQESDGSVSYDPNFADSSQVMAERNGSEVLASNLSETLAEVEHALAKLERGEYGICETCGKQISQARMEAIPTARFCINDASQVTHVGRGN